MRTLAVEKFLHRSLSWGRPITVFQNLIRNKNNHGNDKPLPIGFYTMEDSEAPNKESRTQREITSLL